MVPRGTGALLLAALFLGVTGRARAGNVDVFAIGLEEVVSDGMPGPGAGNIESPGATDQYTLTVDPGTLVYVDELAGLCAIRWCLEDALGAVVFTDFAMCSGDPGQFTLAGGTYTMTVYGVGDTTGVYSFTIWEVNPIEMFAISRKEVVAEDVPGAGAGNIEEPGAIDVYEIDLATGVEVYFDELSGPCSVQWCMEAPDGSEVFSDPFFCSTDPGHYTAEQSGTYTISVSGRGDGTGTYSFTTWDVNPDETFAIALEEIVSDGVPGAGAGNIEEPGTRDVYEVDVAAGQTVFFDELGGPCAVRWCAEAPDGTEVFFNPFFCSTDPGLYTAEQSGTYTITVYGNGDATGAYSFTIWEVNPVDTFAIALEEIVSDGVPGAGAGNIEEPGAIDVYTLTVPPQTLVCFQELGGGCNVGWRAEDPNGVEVFDDRNMCAINAGRFRLETGGVYTITVFGAGDATGAYSFAVIPGRAADLDGDCAVGFNDLSLLLGSWGTPGGDVDGDGTTGFVDLVALLGDWG